ncbi:MAG: hypothetical protein ACJAYB_002127 [Psychromonas sp.]|jgi:hypothetical protein
MPVSSAIIADGEMYTDGQGMKAHLEPIAMSRDDIISTQKSLSWWQRLLRSARVR